MTFATISATAAVISASCVGGNVLNLVAIKLEASDFFLGLINFAIAAPFAVGLLCINLLERIGKRKILIFWLCGVALLTIPLMLIPLFVKLDFSNNTCLKILLITIFLRTCMNGLASSGWFPLLQDIVPRRITGTFFGRLRTIWQIAAFIFLVGVALFLGKVAPWWKFEVLYCLSFLAIIIRIVSIIPMAENIKTVKAQAQSGIFSKIIETLRNKSSRTALLYLISYTMSVAATMPFAVKMIKSEGFGDNFVLGASAMASLGAIISLRFWGKLADKFGNRAIFSLSHAGMIMSTLMWIVFDNSIFGAVLVYFLFFATSVFNSGNNISQTRYLFHNTPGDKQYHMVIINTLTIFAWSFSPLLAGTFLLLTKNVSFKSGGFDFNNYHMFFLCNAACFFVPHLIRKKLNIQDEESTIKVVGFVTRPILQSFSPFVRIWR